VKDMKFEIKLLNPKARTPKYAHKTDAGCDLYCLDDVILEPGVVKIVPTGIAVNIPEGYEGQIRSRSSVATKKTIIIPNAPATIDSGFCGEICVALLNLGNHTQGFSAGDRIAQLIFSPIVYAEFIEVEELDDTERGENGFGSSGK
jgi:dUTP pyrophosphatase